MGIGLKRSALLMLGLALMTSAASAQTPSRLWSVCGGNIFNTCASVELTVLGTVVTVRAQNLSGASGTYTGTVFTGIGFDNLNLAAVYDIQQGGQLVAASTNMSGPRISALGGTTFGDPAAWIARNERQIGGGIQLDLVGTTVDGVDDGIASDCAQAGELPGGTNTLWASFLGCGGAYTIGNSATNGGWVVFSFNVEANSVTQSDLDNATLLVKGQNGPGGESTQLICGPGECEPPGEVIPEPISMVLLGSGLLGIGAVRRRRRSGSDPGAN